MKNKAFKILFLLMIMTSGLILGGCHQSSDITQSSWKNIQQRKRIVIGLDDSFVPMGFRQKDGTLTGYDVDVAKAVFDQYGIKVDFQTINWSMNVTELRNQTIDAIWNGLTITPSREKALTFSDPYLVNQQVLVVKKNSHIKNINDFKGKRLGAQSGSSASQDLDTYPKLLKDKIKNQSPILYDSINNALIDLDANRVQGLLIDRVYAQYYVKHSAHPDQYLIIPSNMPNEKFAVGVKKHNTELQQKINQGLKKVQANGELDKINKKWFGKEHVTVN